MQVPTVKLNNGVEMPQLGFGVFQVPPDEVIEPVRTALDAGYRLIDTAAAYGNEEGVGRAIAESGVARDDLFVTTKLWNTDQGYDQALKAFDESMIKLGLDQLDLYLIHWPVPKRDRYVDTWRALEKILADGRARAIGVSNFTAAHLTRLTEETGTVPAVNQVELHPGYPQEGLQGTHDYLGIVTEAWSPIGQGQGLLDHEVVRKVASDAGRSPAQVVLRWHLQQNIVVIPKSVHAERIRENIDVFDFELDADAMAALTAIGTDDRIGPDPETFELP